MNTNISTDKFSATRFMMLAKREITSRKKLLIMQMAVIAGLILLSEVCISWLGYPSVEDCINNQNYEYISSRYTSDSVVGIICGAGIIGLSFLSCIAGSLVCSGLSSRRGRIDNFMTVGSPLEKYLVNLLLHTVVFTVYFFAVWLIIDFGRCVYIDMLYPFKGELFISYLFSVTPGEAILSAVSSYLFTQAFFVLISAFSPKWAFLKGFALWYGISFLLVPITMLLFALTASDLAYTDSFYSITTACALALCFTAAMHWLAYYRYKETDII